MLLFLISLFSVLFKIMGGLELTTTDSEPEAYNKLPVRHSAETDCNLAETFS